MSEALTLKAAWPFCHASGEPSSFAHFEEFDFRVLTDLASASVAGIWIRR